VVSIIFRLIFIVSLPALSDDYFRFIWDGRLWQAGYHPFAELPADYLSKNIEGIDQSLFSHLNSKEYFTIYPPISQSIFFISTKIFPRSIIGAVVVMRGILILIEIGNLILIKKLLNQFNLPPRNILMYALNPLVIIELTGNIHFEAIVIFFVLLSVYLLHSRKNTLSSLSMVLAIATKLVPLIFFPVWFRVHGYKQFIKYALVTFVFLVMSFATMFDLDLVSSMTKSVSLYFNKFEFNASIYYLVREFGYWKYGYNIIQTVGWKLGVITSLLILIYTFRNGWSREPMDLNSNTKFIFEDWMWILTIYFAITTTLHPWYVTTLLAFSVFSNYKFPLAWTGLIFLTYSGYSDDGFHESMMILGIEYLIVYTYLLLELKANQKWKPL
jgi:hypothetical protein